MMTDMETETDKVVSDILFNDSDDDMDTTNVDVEQADDDFHASLHDAMNEAASFLDSDDDEDPPMGALDEEDFFAHCGAPANNNDNSPSGDNDELVAVNQTLSTMAATQLCVHPQHAHSFAKASTFLTAVGLRQQSCAGCQQNLKQGGIFSGGNNDNNAIADPSVVKCMACGALAHRSCALNSTMEWKEICPVNGPSIQKATSAGVTGEEEDGHIYDPDIIDGDEYEMGLNDNDKVERNGIGKNNSFISYSGSEQSMESQELGEGEAGHPSDNEDSGSGAKIGVAVSDQIILDLTDPDVAAAVTAASKEREKAEADLISSPGGGRGDKSPGTGRRVISKLLFNKKNQQVQGDVKEVLNNIMSGDEVDNKQEEAAQQHQEDENASENVHSADSQQPGGDKAEIVSPTSGKRMTWFRKNDNEQTATTDGPAADSKPSWFNRKSDSDSADRATHANESATEANEPLRIRPRLPWMSVVTNSVEEDYGDTANDNDPSPTDEIVVSKDTEEADEPSNEAAPRIGWFQRRATPNATTTTGTQPEAEEPPSPTPKIFSLFSRNSVQNDERPNDGEDNNATSEEASEPQDSHEAEFSEFLDVDEEDNTPGSPSRQQRKREQDKDTNESGNLQQNGAPEKSASEPAAELKPSKRGFSLFRRRIPAEENPEGASAGNEADNQGKNDDDENESSSVAEPAGTEGADIGNVGKDANDSEEFPDMQDIKLETTVGLVEDQASIKQRFRLFARKREGTPTKENVPAVDDQVGDLVNPQGAPPVSPVRRSLFNWGKNDQPTEERTDGDDIINPEPTEKTSVKEDGNEGEPEHTDQRPFLSRVFTPVKGSIDGEMETADNAAEDDATVNDTSDETTPRRFSLFSRREAASDISPKEGTPVDAEAGTPDQDHPVTPRRFSIFAFRSGGNDENQDESETVAFEQDKSWAAEAPPSHWKTATSPTCQASPKVGEDADSNSEDGGETDPIPLHYAKHPFASVSRALEDNILALLDSSEEGGSSKLAALAETADVNDAQGTDNGNARETTPEKSPRKPQSSVSLIVSPDVPEETDAGDAGLALGEIRPEPEQESILLKAASGTYEAVKATALAQQKLGMASVAGGIAGGVAGLMFAGPAGALMGVRYGQTAGALGVVLEGSFTVGVIIAGVSGGRIAADKIQEQLEENRILTIGEHGVTRKVMLVRPTIRIDPAWHEIWAEAQRTSPSSSAPIFSLFSTTDSIKQDRYEKTADICEEEDIPIEEKVLLLVSRVLSDKGSFPGHVYRCLMKAFKDRCQERNELRDKLSQEKEDFPHLFDGAAEESVTFGDEIMVSLSPRARREDTHGVIKYITATLLEVRPGLASTAEITETTASVVEALVFGEVYDLVYEEIAIEATEKDKQLIERIDDFEFTRVERTGMPLCTEQVVSQEAIAALKRIPENHTAVDKLRHCVAFLEKISEHFATVSSSTAMGADSLLKMVCQHLVAAKLPGVNAEVAFLEEFARDQQLLRGKEGYALVTLQASLHFLNMSRDFERDIFGQDNDEENVPMVEASESLVEVATGNAAEDIGANNESPTDANPTSGKDDFDLQIPRLDAGELVEANKGQDQGRSEDAPSAKEDRSADEATEEDACSARIESV